jgi:hypothetical protein
MYERFRDSLATIPWEFVTTPSDEVLRIYEHVIHSKDAHVLAAALDARCEFLLTLDHDFFTSTVSNANLPITLLSPGAFIQRFYRLHPDYSSLPPVREG